MPKEKLNAVVTATKSKDKKYTNLFVEFDDIRILVKPIVKDKRTLAKLMYKISCALGVEDE